MNKGQISKILNLSICKYLNTTTIFLNLYFYMKKYKLMIENNRFSLKFSMLLDHISLNEEKIQIDLNKDEKNRNGL